MTQYNTCTNKVQNCICTNDIQYMKYMHKISHNTSHGIHQKCLGTNDMQYIHAQIYAHMTCNTFGAHEPWHATQCTPELHGIQYAQQSMIQYHICTHYLKYINIRIHAQVKRRVHPRTTCNSVRTGIKDRIYRVNACITWNTETYASMHKYKELHTHTKACTYDIQHSRCTQESWLVMQCTPRNQGYNTICARITWNTSTHASMHGYKKLHTHTNARTYDIQHSRCTQESMIQYNIRTHYLKYINICISAT